MTFYNLMCNCVSGISLVMTWKQRHISVMLGKSGKMMEKSTWLAGATMSISSGAIGPEGDEDLKANLSALSRSRRFWLCCHESMGNYLDCMIFIQLIRITKLDKWFETWYGLLSSSGPGIGPITSPLYFFLEGIKAVFSQSAGLIYKTSLYKWKITLVSGRVGKNDFCNCALFSTESIV